MRWLVADSLYCPEQFFCSHLDSYSHYLREAGEEVRSWCLNLKDGPGDVREGDSIRRADVVFALDRYDWPPTLRFPEHEPGRWNGDGWPRPKFIAQVAAVCSPMPWEVRKPDGSPVYDLVLSSIPWMVEAARAAGCRAEYMPLAFDARARVCGMGVERDLDCIFIGTVGPNHKRRAKLLAELADVVTVMLPVFGREYFKALARARAVVNVHAEWARGAANNMRIFEAAGMGCQVVSDGRFADSVGLTVVDWGDDWRQAISFALSGAAMSPSGVLLRDHTYESRIPKLIELARSL